MQRTGIPASITLAQGILESGSGRSTLATKANNHFGIKCHNWKGRTIYHDDDKRNECFRRYRDANESYKDHSDFLVTTPRYRFLFDLPHDDYKKWARGLKKAGYATNPHYARRLIHIIEENALYKYDQMIDNTVLYAETDLRQVKEYNRIDYIISRPGDTFESLAESYDKFPGEIARYNEMEKHENIPDGVKIYLQPKRRKAPRGNDYHIMKKNEDLYEIAQKYGIKTKHLCRKNNINPDAELSPGQKLSLRKRLKGEPEFVSLKGRKQKKSNLNTTSLTKQENNQNRKAQQEPVSNDEDGFIFQLEE
jgi:flagellum-specific peptidoglycan hydrolase FlgJ